MTVLELLAGLQKYHNKNIEFYIVENPYEGDLDRLEIYISDGLFIFDKKDKGGMPTNTVCLSFIRSSLVEAIKNFKEKIE